ncbi:piwi [Acrasis kona]|uniref:Piwi n=1 Tax=Acrasis kona TaxID=1008807 RepID=A0AAW2YV21_9EUKA
MILTQEQFQEYKEKLDEDGYVVVKGLVSPTKAQEYESRFWDYIESLSESKLIDRNDPTTWNDENWPNNIHGIFKNFKIGHAQFVWDARDEDGIVGLYQQLWNTEDLLVSFDGACMIRPSVWNHKTNNWAHTDQAPLIELSEYNAKPKMVRDFPCVQGLLNLRPCGPNDGGLVVYKGSHKHHQHYFIKKGIDQKINKPWKDSKNHWHLIDQEVEDNRKFLSKFEKIKVCCDPGDFIIWHSRTVHYAEAIDKTLNTDPLAHRMCIYICMLPSKYATASDLHKKREALSELQTTSHWPCIKIKTNKNDRPNITKGFVVPEVLPVLTDRMKRLAGVEPSFQFTDNYVQKKYSSKSK